MADRKSLYCVFTCLLMLAALFPLSGPAGAASTRTVWTYSAPGEIRTTPAIGDLYGDGTPEVVVTAQTGGVMVLDSSGALKWAFQRPAGISSSPLLADVNSDGRPEIIAGIADGTVVALVPGSDPLWSYASGGAVRSSPAAADINGDGKLEVIFGSDDNSVYALDSAGKKLWSFATTGDVSASPAVGDVNQDGKPEIAVPSEDGTLYLLDTAGSPRWAKVLGAPMSGSPAMADVDGDGFAEVLAAAMDGKVYAVDRVGVIKWTFTAGGAINSSVVAGDVDGNGETEVIFGCADGKLYCISPKGTLKWSYPTGGITGSPALFAAGGEKRIAFYSGDGNTYVLNGKAAKLWTYPSANYPPASPVIGDLKGAGESYLIIGGRDSTVSCANTGELATLDWRMLQHDPARTGNLLSTKGGVLPGTYLWSNLLAARVQDTPALADVNGDGMREAAVGASDGRIYLLRTTNGSQVWTFASGPGYQSLVSPLIADINGNNVLEVVGGSTDGNLYALYPSNGTRMWENAMAVWDSTPSGADIDGDGTYEVMMGGGTNEYFVLNGNNGSVKTKTLLGGVISNPAAIADVNGDGKLESVVGAGDGILRAVWPNGTVAWSTPSLSASGWISPPALGDMDGDGYLDAIVGTGNGFVHAFSGYNGAELWKRSLGATVAVYAAPMVLNVPGGSSWDVVVVADDGNLQALSGDDGQVIWKVMIGAQSSAAAADIDADGALDIVLGTKNGIAAYSPAGMLMWSFPSVGGVVASPSVSDVNNDGALEVVFGAQDGRVYGVCAGGLCDKGANPWPTYCHDNRRTGNPYSFDGKFLPDIVLTPGLITLPTALPNEGTSIFVNVTVRNAGASPADGFSVTLTDNGNPITDPAWVSTLPAASDVTLPFNWTPVGGIHTLRASADTTTAITESREDNNNASRDVRVNYRPIADAGSDMRVGLGDIVIFDGSASRDVDGIIKEYNWSFGDGNWSRGPNPTHKYTAFGNFTVTLTVTDDSDITGADSIFVSVNSPPKIVNWTPAGDVVLAESATQYFSITVLDPEGDIINVTWTLDGVAVAHGTAHTYVPDYYSAGHHTLVVKATDGAMSAERSWGIDVTDAESPIMSFTPADRNLTLNTGDAQGFKLVLRDKYPVKWSVDGAVINGALSTEFVLSTGRSSAGRHTVRATVSAAGHDDWREWEVRVFQFNSPPSIDFSEPSADSFMILADGKQLFTVAVSDKDSPAMYIHWFQDGAALLNETERDFLFIERVGRGTRNITVIVSDGDSSVSRTWLLSVNNPPTSLFKPGQKSVVVKTSVTFDGAASFDTDGRIVSYAWDFGDGVTQVTNTSGQKHTYQRTGVYLVELRVTDDRGANSTARMTVVVTKAEEKVGTPGFELLLAAPALLAAALWFGRRRED